jgi:hypothetical protein
MSAAVVSVPPSWNARSVGKSLRFRGLGEPGSRRVGGLLNPAGSRRLLGTTEATGREHGR